MSKKIEKEFNKKLQESFAYAKTTLDSWNDSQILMKMNEEFGELSENILFELGQVQHKKLNESLTSEIADCLIMVTHYTSSFLKEFPDISIKYSKLISKINFYIKNSDNFSDYEDLYQILDKEFSLLKDPMAILDPYGFQTIQHFINSLIRFNTIYSIHNIKEIPELTEDKFFEYSLNNLINTMDKKLQKWKLVEKKY
tara:strand:- start:949 stop:1542 length:594 start_codon:yes stop_codon:yes gene_type:complete